MSEAPSWLTSDRPSVVATPAPAPLEVDHGTAPASESNYGVSESDDKDLPGIILTMRLANMGVAAYLITVSVRNFLVWEKLCGSSTGDTLCLFTHFLY